MKRLLGADYPAPDSTLRSAASRSTASTSSSSSTPRAACSELRLAADAAQDARGARRLPDGEGLAGHERRGRLHVPVLRGQVDARHAGASARSSSTGCATGTRSATRARSRASRRRSAPTTRAAGRISLYVLGDEFTGDSVDSVVRAVDRINREDTRGQRRVRIHAIGFPTCSPDAPAVHRRALRHADARPLRAQRRHLRRPERAGQLPALSPGVRGSMPMHTQDRHRGKLDALGGSRLGDRRCSCCSAAAARRGSRRRP